MLLTLNPLEMTPEVMQSLEDKGLIIRLCPNHHSAVTRHDHSNNAVIYASQPENGPHKLIVATINALNVAPYFGTHVDNEEFLLIGDPATKPFYLLVALCKRAELEEKIKTHTLSADDFAALHVRFNDPEVSFFVMLKDVPHGEVTVDGPGTPASFYVTEPRDITTELVDLMDYRLEVGIK